MSLDTTGRPVPKNAPLRAAPENTDANRAVTQNRTLFPLTIAQTPIALDAMALPNSPAANTGDIARISGPIDTKLFAEAVRRVVAETAAIRVSLHYRDGSLHQEFPKLDDYALEQRD